MKNVITACLVGLFAVACQAKVSDLSSKKKDSKKDDELPLIAKKVNALKSESGVLNCAGVDKKLQLIRSIATFNSGKLESLTVSAYANKDNPSQVPNELTEDLKKFEVFSHEVTKNMIDLELDLDGKNFDIEVFSPVNGKSRKMYDLEIRTENDGEGGSALNGYLSYKDIPSALDLSEIFMACAVLPKK